jgi:hypothetical protein
MKTSTALLFSVASLAACHTMTAPVEDDVQVGQAMYSRYIASEDHRQCTVEDHLEAMRTGISRGCTFCQALTTDDVVAGVNDAVRKGPVPGPYEPIFTFGTLPDLDFAAAILIDSRGRSVVYSDFFVRDFDGNWFQTQKFDDEYNIIWSLSDEIRGMDKYEEYSAIVQACTQEANVYQSDRTQR